MALAMHLSDTVNLKERVPFEPIPAGILCNWGPDGQTPAGRVVEEARRFVADTDFNEFCQGHESLYRETESRYRQQIESEAHLEWFASIFGHRPGLPAHIVLCLQNDGCNYPGLVQLGDRVEYYVFIGVGIWDEDGVPAYPAKAGYWTVGPIVHELLHLYLAPHFGAPASYLSAEGMREAGERLLESVGDSLDLDAYGEWWCVIDETVVNAWQVRYELATRGREAAEGCAAQAVRKGLLWTPALAELLAEYEADRTRYPQFDSFTPKLVEFFREQAGLPKQ